MFRVKGGGGGSSFLLNFRLMFLTGDCDLVGKSFGVLKVFLKFF